MFALISVLRTESHHCWVVQSRKPSVCSHIPEPAVSETCCMCWLAENNQLSWRWNKPAVNHVLFSCIKLNGEHVLHWIFLWLHLYEHASCKYIFSKLYVCSSLLQWCFSNVVSFQHLRSSFCSQPSSLFVWRLCRPRHNHSLL